ncbi:long-chain fatty acid--CoA ligase [Catenovulum sp. SM1970]|uniref:ANL family adenylate-forming protein n=1 Tax=Marinifaba aquimaris TaxID=2741323 RepID=UPI0015734299|nr:fatty acid--CoA ligase family protein [Marinifaba aquimaris]NTS75374.1 long-chain fatty acid--CoA ligase [Marinifaba aquimaris]
MLEAQFIGFLLERFEQNRDKDAIVWREQVYSYAWLKDKVETWHQALIDSDIEHGHVVMVEADYSPSSIALLIALIEYQAIIVPITDSVSHKKEEFIETAQAEYLIQIAADDSCQFTSLNQNAEHDCFSKLRSEKVPGLILFSSGSTGKSKAAVHDLAKLLEKYKVPRHALRAITFLLYDHIGGVNTLLYTLSNAGCVITVADRKPDTVLAAVDKFSADLLPTSPTFINLILISEAYQRHQLTSLKTVTYGTEPMPESTLLRFNKQFPHIKLLQTYGLSELGILRSKSKDNDSLWVKIGGEGFETRVTGDNILEIKAYSGMLGYLNAPSPYTEDGWFHTGDQVEVDGEYMRILGRKSEIINVGGQKVYPAEVESVLQQLDFIAESEVYGEKNALLGNVVCAKLRLNTLAAEQDKKTLKRQIKQHCSQSLESFQVPAKFKFDDSEQFSPRFKKMRTL